jgi:hypothetical protein
MSDRITQHTIAYMIEAMQPQTVIPSDTGFLNRPARERHAGAYIKAIQFLRELDDKLPFHPLKIENGRLTHADFSANVADIEGVRQDMNVISESFSIKPGAGTYTVVPVDLRICSIYLLHRGHEYRIPVIVHPKDDGSRQFDETLEAFLFGLALPMTRVYHDRIKGGEYVTIDDVGFDQNGMTFTTGMLWGKKTHKLGYKDATMSQSSSWLSECLRVESKFDPKIRTNIRINKWNGPLALTIVTSFASGFTELEQKMPPKYRTTA